MTLALQHALKVAASQSQQPTGHPETMRRFADRDSLTCVCGVLVRHHFDRQNRRITCAEATLVELAALRQVGTRHEA